MLPPFVLLLLLQGCLCNLRSFRLRCTSKEGLGNFNSFSNSESQVSLWIYYRDFCSQVLSLEMLRSYKAIQTMTPMQTFFCSSLSCMLCSKTGDLQTLQWGLTFQWSLYDFALSIFGKKDNKNIVSEGWRIQNLSQMPFTPSHLNLKQYNPRPHTGKIGASSPSNLHTKWG